MKTLQDIIFALADTMVYWRDGAIALLVCVVIGCLLFVGVLYDA